MQKTSWAEQVALSELCSPEGVEVFELGQEELEEREDDGPPGERAGAVAVGSPRSNSPVHSVVACAAVHRLPKHSAASW